MWRQAMISRRAVTARIIELASAGMSAQLVAILVSSEYPDARIKDRVVRHTIRAWRMETANA